LTHPALALLIGPEFDEFLYAPIGANRNGTGLSVLSALAPRRLLIHGARATVARVRSGQMKSAWLSGLLSRRHFNVAKIVPLFPFGFGISYTKFRFGRADAFG
jgi:hypothetical protein